MNADPDAAVRVFIWKDNGGPLLEGGDEKGGAHLAALLPLAPLLLAGATAGPA